LCRSVAVGIDAYDEATALRKWTPQHTVTGTEEYVERETLSQ
jgi:hypothetical protein